MAFGVAGLFTVTRVAPHASGRLLMLVDGVERFDLDLFRFSLLDFGSVSGWSMDGAPITWTRIRPRRRFHNSWFCDRKSGWTSLGPAK